MPDLYIHTTQQGQIFALGAKPRPPDPREWRYELVPRTAVDRSQPRSLARFFPPVMNQGTEGSCTANSSVAVQMACAAIAGEQPEMLSREELYYLERVKEGTFPQDVGAYTADSFDCVLEHQGLPSEAAWPYDMDPAEQPPGGLDEQPRYLYIKAHQPLAGANFIDGTLSALDEQKPLVLAFAFYQQFFDEFAQTGVLSGQPAGQPVGGHQVAIWGWVPEYQLVACRNSWGATSPARTDLHPDAIAGDVFLPAALFQNGIVEEIRAAVGAAQPHPAPEPGPQPTDVKAKADAALVGCIASLTASAQRAKYKYQRLAYSEGAEYVEWAKGEMDQALI